MGYDRADEPPFLFRGTLDGRLLPKERVAGLTVGGEDAAFPFSLLNEERVVNYMLGGQNLVVFFKPGTRSALDGLLIGSSREVGATGIFETALNGQELTFRADGDRFVDEETGRSSPHTVSFGEILSGGVPRDGIPPLDNPTFTSVEDANNWLEDLEPVISLEVNGEAKAYPLQILIWHEIVNDEIGGIPVSATFCPLCNSAIVFDRRLDGVVHDFGVSGKLRNSDLIMWDRQTETWWQQLTGDGIVGELAGKKLTFIPATIISWADFKAAHPDALVLDKKTGFDRSYGENPVFLTGG